MTDLVEHDVNEKRRHPLGVGVCQGLDQLFLFLRGELVGICVELEDWHFVSGRRATGVK